MILMRHSEIRSGARFVRFSMLWKSVLVREQSNRWISYRIKRDLEKKGTVRAYTLGSMGVGQGGTIKSGVV